MIELLVIGGIVAAIASARREQPRVRAGYKFHYRKVNGSWRAYIIEQPSYGLRDPDPYVTHRLCDSNGDWYVCWSTVIATEEECRSVADHWASCTDKYIASGATF